MRRPSAEANHRNALKRASACVGLRSGRWTATGVIHGPPVLLEVLCDCGTARIVRPSHFRNERSPACSSCAVTKQRAVIDRSGMVVGIVRVVAPLCANPSGWLWVCRCACGVWLSSYGNKIPRSCGSPGCPGAKRFKPRAVGYWILESVVYRSGKQVAYKARHSCGWRQAVSCRAAGDRRGTLCLACRPAKCQVCGQSVTQDPASSRPRRVCDECMLLCRGVKIHPRLKRAAILLARVNRKLSSIEQGVSK